MEKQVFIDRILETENLTDELVDADANWLLNWGIASLDQVLAGVSDIEIAGARVNALMAVMRKINRLSAIYPKKPAPELAQDLSALQDLLAAAFNRPITKSTDRLLAVASGLQKTPTRQVLEFLTQLGKA